ATAIPLACNPDVLSEYWDAMVHRTPEHWKSPTLGSLLRELYGHDSFALQFAPTILGLGWLAIHGWKCRHQAWDWSEQLPLIVLVSFVTASYGAWPFDLVILLPTIIQVAAGLATDRRRIPLAIALFAAINAGALALNVLHVSSDRFVWMAPSLLAAYLLPPSPSAGP